MARTRNSSQYLAAHLAAAIGLGLCAMIFSHVTGCEGNGAQRDDTWNGATRFIRNGTGGESGTGFGTAGDRMGVTDFGRTGVDTQPRIEGQQSESESVGTPRVRSPFPGVTPAPTEPGSAGSAGQGGIPQQPGTGGGIDRPGQTPDSTGGAGGVTTLATPRPPGTSGTTGGAAGTGTPLPSSPGTGTGTGTDTDTDSGTTGGTSPDASGSGGAGGSGGGGAGGSGGSGGGGGGGGGSPGAR